MKRIALIFFLFPCVCVSQSNERFFEIKQDTLLFYLNRIGDITTKSHSYYYRKAKINKDHLYYEGIVQDFYKDNQLAFQQEFENGLLNGSTVQYNENGKLHHEGQYVNSFRDGKWKYYYKKGSLEKVIEYKSGVPHLQAYYKKNGKEIFTDGNGKYKGNIYIGEKALNSYSVSGKVKDGKQDGWWNFSGGREYFEDGVFIRGVTSWSEYTHEPAITFTGYNVHEDASVFRFIAIPEANTHNYLFSQMLTYNDSPRLDEDFKSDLSRFLYNINYENSLDNYWCFLQFTVGDDDRVSNVMLHSNNTTINTKLRKYISELDKFIAPHPNKQPTACSIYLSFYVVGGKIMMPEYSFASGISITSLIPKN